MKATLDIPDELYRRVKARSAMEGRPLRTVVVELFQKWLDQSPVHTVLPDSQANQETAPWLAITRRHVRLGMSHDMESIRAGIAAGWSAESTEEVKSPSD